MFLWFEAAVCVWEQNEMEVLTYLQSMKTECLSSNPNSLRWPSQAGIVPPGHPYKESLTKDCGYFMGS